MFFKMGAFKNFVYFTGKHLCWSFFLIKLQALRSGTLLKKTATRCFPVKFANLRTPFFTEQLRWLPLKIIDEYDE